MKKLIYLIMLIAILGLIVPGCIPVVPHSEQDELGNLEIVSISKNGGITIDGVLSSGEWDAYYLGTSVTGWSGGMSVDVYGYADDTYLYVAYLADITQPGWSVAASLGIGPNFDYWTPSSANWPEAGFTHISVGGDGFAQTDGSYWVWPDGWGNTASSVFTNRGIEYYIGDPMWNTLPNPNVAELKIPLILLAYAGDDGQIGLSGQYWQYDRATPFYVELPPQIQICETDLLAGNPKNEKIDAGDVIVEYISGTDHLTVTYNTEDGWLMDEIHFHAASATPYDSNLLWPLTKKGNPIPGQFAYKFEDLEGTDKEEYEFIIPLTDIFSTIEEACGPLYFAAHAEVYKLSDVIDDEFIVSEADSSMVYAYEEDTGNLGYPSSTPYKSGSAVEALYPSWPGISGAKWISLGDWLEDVADSDPDNHKEGWWGDYINSWWKFERTIDIPLNAVDISGALTITSDNVESIELNSASVGGYTDVYDDFSDSQQWKYLNTHNIDLLPGPNDLNIMVRNFPRLETDSWDNPVGMIYRLDYEYQLKTEETAWGEGDDFPGRNWAMYFGCPNFLAECPE